MPKNEFDIIQTYFQSRTVKHPNVIVGSGDDGALVEVPKDHHLAIVMDTMVEGVHFPKDTPPEGIGHKILAVNLSDLAAMGAQPAWFTLALTMPRVHEAWLENFSTGLFALANQYGCELIGGDLTRGPLTLTLEAHGFVPKTKRMLRNQAQVGDLIYVSNTLGDAGFGLQQVLHKKNDDYFLKKLNYPTPRVELGLAIREFAHAAIDISDGLISDLGHILKASKVGAEIDVLKLPISKQLRESVPLEDCQKLALTAGDDYELCFTIPSSQQAALEKMLAKHQWDCSCIGVITEQPGLRLLNTQLPETLTGFRHF